MNRAEFLKLMSISSLSYLLNGGNGLEAGKNPRLSEHNDDPVERMFAESMIIDGLVNLGMKRGEGVTPFEPGAIKKLTGIDAGAHTTRVDTLKSRNKWAESHKDALMKIEKAGDFDIALATGRYGIIFYVQSEFDLKGSLEPLTSYKEEGVRAFQLAYRDNDIGGAEKSNDLPLTPFGKKVVEELNRLHMVIDVSHCGRRTTLDAVETSSGPIMANHANSEALVPVGRNKSDEEIEAIARRGGVVGITTINRFLTKNPSKPAGIEELTDHIDYMVEKIGIDHVGVASDCYLDGSQRYEVDYTDRLINSPERWKHVASRLHSRGYGVEDLKRIFGLNFKRIYKSVLDP